MRKTQLGPGLAESGLGSCCEGSAILRAGHRTERGEKDAARPRGIQRPCWGELRDVKRPACNAVADRRMLNLRPSCVSYAAGVRRRPERRTHSNRDVQRTKRRTHSGQGVPTSEAAFRRARLNPWTTSRSGKAGVPPGRPLGEQGSILPVYSPGRLFGEQGSILCSRSRIRGTESSRFLGRETLEKPDNDLSITPHLSVGKGFGASPAKVFDPVQFSSEKLQFTSDKVW